MPSLLQKGELEKPKGYTCLLSPFSQRNVLYLAFCPAYQLGNTFMLFQPKANQDLAEIHLTLSYSFPQASTRVPGPHGRAVGHQGAAEMFPPAQSTIKFGESWWSLLLLTIFPRNE